MHDCGKPYCITIDEAGRRHFPDHANVSANTFAQISDNKIVKDLIILIVILRHISTGSMGLLKLKIVNTNYELILEATHRETVSLIVIVYVGATIKVNQVAGPSTFCVGL